MTKDIKKIKKAEKARLEEEAMNKILDREMKELEKSKHFEALRLIYKNKPRLADWIVDVIEKLEKQWMDLEQIKPIIAMANEYVFTQIVMLLKNDKN